MVVSLTHIFLFVELGMWRTIVRAAVLGMMYSVTVSSYNDHASSQIEDDFVISEVKALFMQP